MIGPINNDQHICIVAKLAVEIWNEHYIPIIGKNQVDYMLEKYQTKSAIARQINEDNFLYFLIEYQETPVGYFAIQPQKQFLYLSKFYIKSAFRGKGLGKAAMKFIENLVKEKNLSKIRLNVNRNNLSSIRFYENLGFLKCDSVEIDIGSGYAMCDYVMEKNI